MEIYQGGLSFETSLWSFKNLLAIFRGTSSEKCFFLPASDQNSLFRETRYAFRYWCGLGFRNLVSRCHSRGYGQSLWPHRQADRVASCMSHSANCSHTACVSEEDSTFRADYRIKARLIFWTLKRPPLGCKSGFMGATCQGLQLFCLFLYKVIIPFQP